MKTSSEEQPIISRGDFVRNLGLSSAALMALYCMGTVSSCKSSDTTSVTPTPGSGTGTTTGITGNTTAAAGTINFTLDLTNKDYSSLKTEGNFVKVGDVLIMNAKGGKFAAVQRLCTHQLLDQLSYRLSSDDIYCSHQGSEFKTDGTVNKGPAATALKKYTATLSADGNSLQVKA